VGDVNVDFALPGNYYSALLPCFHEFWRMLYLHRNYYNGISNY